MLIITIALVGFSYTYISSISTGETATTFFVVDSFQDTVTISNDGTAVISDIRATLDGSSVAIAVVPNIDGLVGYWSFNEVNCPPTGDCITDDNSRNNNIGTLNGGLDSTGWTTGRFGNGLQFDGNNNYVDIGSSTIFDTSGGITLSAWVNINQNGNNDDQFFWKSDTFQFRRDGSNRLNLRTVDGSSFGSEDTTSAADLMTVGRWHHVAAIYDTARTRIIYLDGVQVAQEINT